MPCPPPEDIPDPGIEPVSLTSPALAGWFFTTSMALSSTLERVPSLSSQPQATKSGAEGTDIDAESLHNYGGGGR